MEAPRQPIEKKIHIGFRRAMMLIVPYVWKRVRAQLQSVWPIIVYLLLFQTLVLRLAVDDALVISAGLVVVIIGLTLFLGGLFRGLMSLGEAIGLRLPRKSGITVILAFSFILGVGATFAEPAIGILRMAGSSVLAWAWFDPNLRHVTGLAWDCGAVTTGPVTVPLVLALGVGISRVVAGSPSGRWKRSPTRWKPRALLMTKRTVSSF